MAIASQNQRPHSTPLFDGDTGSVAAPEPDDIDRLIESISAKVKAQLGSTSLSGLAVPALHTPVVSTADAAADGVENDAVAVDDAIDDDVVEPDTEELAPSSFAGADIQQMAAEGYFQAIAYWLNEKLVPHGVYAQVLADEIPGRLKVLVEFERAPQPDRLAKFVCDRLYRLNSNVIEGVHLIVRALGAAKTDWERSIRIPTAAARQGKVSSPQPDVPTLVHESSHSQIDRQVVISQFKFFRAALVCGSAIAAFFFGSFTEFLLSDRLSLVSSQTAEEKVLPWYGQPDEVAFSPDFSQATSISFRPASRFQGRTVEAAFETVAVIPHNKVVDPADPTITLLFGGDLSLNNFVFEDASQVDQLFSDIDLYQEADVAMVGLAEPLAYASTSLQEDFHQRTRPQAVDTLQSGGIDIVGLSSEGSMTYGARGLTETLINLDRAGIYRVGAGRNQPEAHRPEILEVKGQRIAYLGYNPDALKGAKAEKAGVALTRSEDRQHIAEDIRAIRSQVDWVVVNYRWGDALEADPETAPTDEPADPLTDDASDRPKLLASTPEDWQKSLAHEAVDAGADLVVGYHPTRIQGTEIYRDRPIAYSLGDFVFNNDAIPEQNTQTDTAALKVSLRNQQMKVEFLPLTIRDAKLQMATGEQGAEILQTIRRSSTTLEKPLRFPAVIKASPTFKPSYQDPEAAPSELPAASETPLFEPLEEPYPSLIKQDSASPEADLQELTNTRTEDVQDRSPAAPNPRMRESEALFLPDAEERTPATPVPDTDEQAPLEDLSSSNNLEPEPYFEPERSPSLDSAASETLEPWQDPFAADAAYDTSFDEPLLLEEDFDAADDPSLEEIPDSVGIEESIQPVINSEESIADPVVETYAEPMMGPLSAVPDDAQLELTFEPAPAE